MLQRAASNAYSWWWASHIRTNQSKWLDSHLQEMEDRVKCMLLLLGEEADSFSKRAEMYYKRRPEVITQVEEVYGAYRALAERYDRISGELHKANHTIATAFPDQVQYAMLEEEDDNIPKAFTPVDPRKIHKSTVDGLMKKKKGEQLRPNKEGKNSAAPVNKENAQEEISRLQKAILVMQTEKEFIKSSYESGIAKYWDLEKQINDMHEEVCHFQDEFNESAVIEDDEARALMTATALKSCEDTIINLQEQQKASFIQEKVVSERIKVSREKLKAIMSEHGKSLSESSDQNTGKNHSAEMEDVYYAKQGNFEMQTVVDKIKEHFKSDSDISVVEITEKIDELVNKVVDLELIVSSQTAQMNRLCVENKELENSLQGLEEQKTALVTGSSELNEKLKQAEEELSRLQALESFFHEDEGTIRSNFTDVLGTFRDISEMLQSPVSECQAGSVLMLADEAAAAVEIEDPDKDPITHAYNKESSSSGCDETKQKKPDDDASVDEYEYVSSVDGRVQTDIGQESSRERGSLVRLRHISSDSFGDVDEDQEEISKKDSSSSGDGITDMMKLQQRLNNGLEDKEKVLLAEYTTLLQNYNYTKKKLTEVETKNQECLHEIRSLHGLLNSSGDKEASCHGHQRNPSTCSIERNGSRRGHRRTPSFSSAHQRRQSVSSISKMIRMGSALQEGDGITDAATDTESLNLEDLKLPPIVEMESASPLEKKFRRDIDKLLEENLEFWLKFSASLQRVQEFQTKYGKLQSTIKKLINDNKQELENGGKKDPSTKAESAATEKQLRALTTELQVWSEQNLMLKGELQCRFTSLCDMQEEITAALDMDADTAVEGARFTSYQAAKFQGEVLNMQQENNKVADELQAGLDHVKGLQTEIEKAFAKLHKSVSLSAGSKGRDDGSSELNRVPSKTKVPLQSFLFPVKNKKPSLLARVTPVLQKQQPDMKFLAKLG